MIELQNVTAGYPFQTVLHDISFLIPKGKLISIIGKNGSGKSTLLKTIIGIVAAQSGKIFVDDQLSEKVSRLDKAKKISYLAQGKAVSEMTVEQLVLHGRFPHLTYPRRYGDKDRKLANEALKQMGIADIADAPLFALSGGLRQKAYIAMALAQNTDYILLDEPTAFLDISSQVDFMKILRSLADSGKGIVTVMHDLPLAFVFSDSIAVIKDGQFAVCDTPRNVCASGIVKEIFGIDLLYSAAENSYHYRY